MSSRSLEVAGAAALGDLAVDQLVDPVDAAPEGAEAAGPGRGRRGAAAAAGAGLVVRSRKSRRASRSSASPLPLADAEDGAQDDLQRDRLHPRPQLVRGADRPALDLARGDLGHRLAVGLHPLAVEGRQQQLALAHVGLLVEDEDRVLAEDRREDLVALAGVEDARVAGEDLLDRLGVGEHHPGPLVGDLQREHVAVAGLAGEQHPPRLPRPDRRLDRAWQRRAGRKASLRRPGDSLGSRCRRCLHRASGGDGTPARTAAV